MRSISPSASRSSCGCSGSRAGAPDQPDVAPIRGHVALLASGRRVLARSVSGSLRGGARMSETAAPRGLQWLGPLVAWLLILCGVAAVTWLGTTSPSERQSIEALGLAAAMLLDARLRSGRRRPQSRFIAAGRGRSLPVPGAHVPAQLRRSLDPAELSSSKLPDLFSGTHAALDELHIRIERLERNE